MSTRLVPVLLVAVLLVTSPIAGTALAQPDGGGSSGGAGSASGGGAAPPDEGSGAGGSDSASGGGGASGSASGGGSARGGASGSGSTAAGDGGGASANRTLPGVGIVRDAATAGETRYLAGVIPERRAPNATLTRVAANGSVTWQRTFGGQNESRVALAVAAGPDGGAYLLARVGPEGEPGAPQQEATRPTAHLTRVASDGTVGWSRSLGNVTRFPRGADLVAHDGGVTVVRQSPSDEPATRLTRYTTAGEVDWTRTYAGGTPRALAMAPDGDTFVAGQRGFRDVWLLRVAPNGTALVNRTVSAGDGRRVTGVVPAGEGALLAGTAETRGFSDSDAWVARVDGDGVVRWSRTYGTAARASPRAAVAVDDGLLLATEERPRVGERTTTLRLVTPTGAVGRTQVAAAPRLAAVTPTTDGGVSVYGVEFDRENRTAVGTVRTADLPTPRPDGRPVHAALASNETRFRGQNLRVPDDDGFVHELYRLPEARERRGGRDADDRDAAPELVRRVRADGERTLETATLPAGRYALRAGSGYWLRVDGGEYHLTRSAATASFELDERDLFLDRRGRRGVDAFDRSTVETYAGERTLEIPVRARGGPFTGRLSLRPLQGSGPDAATMADVVAPGPDSDRSAVFTGAGRTYGTTTVPADGNVTLDAGALPAGLYEFTLTGNETADATEPGTDRFVVVRERRNVTLEPVNRTLAPGADDEAATALRLRGADAGLGAVRVTAERRGPPAVRLDLGLGDAIDAGSASSGGGIGPGRSTAETQTLEVRNAPNGTFVVAQLTVEPSDFDSRRDEDAETPDTQTVRVGLAFAVDADGVPYTPSPETTVTYEVPEDDGSGGDEDDRRGDGT